MAKGLKTGGRDLAKGQTANPKGRPKLPEDIKALRKLSPYILTHYINRIGQMSEDELSLFLIDPKTPMLQKTLGKIFEVALKHGDFSRLGFLIDRAIGPMRPNEANLNVNMNLSHLPREKVIELGRNAIRQLESGDIPEDEGDDFDL